MNAIIITIGDEILYGQTIDTNSAWLARELNSLGIDVIEIRSVSDRKDSIENALKEALDRADMVFLTGGLGPTNDDITKKTLAQFFGKNLVHNKSVEENIQKLFRQWGRKASPANLSQAEIPENATPLHNPLGTAPGMWFDINGKIVVSMPGVPHEMQAIFSNEVVPLLKKKWTLPALSHRFVMTAGMGESQIAERLQRFEKNLPENVRLAYLPSLGMVKLRLTAKGSDKAKLESLLDRLSKEVMSALPDIVYYKGDDESMSISKALGLALLKKNATLGTAESCTGGKIASDITSIPGASLYFKGSVVSYSNEIKMKVLGVKQETLEKEGAVSEETVKEMVRGAIQLLNVDYAVAVSGIAGPTGGTPDKPVGTVWTAIASKDRIKTKLLHLSGGRLQIIRLTSNLSQAILRKFILNED